MSPQRALQNRRASCWRRARAPRPLQPHLADAIGQPQPTRVRARPLVGKAITRTNAKGRLRQRLRLNRNQSQASGRTQQAKPRHPARASVSRFRPTTSQTCQITARLGKATPCGIQAWRKTTPCRLSPPEGTRSSKHAQGLLRDQRSGAPR